MGRPLQPVPEEAECVIRARDVGVDDKKGEQPGPGEQQGASLQGPPPSLPAPGLGRWRPTRGSAR